MLPEKPHISSSGNLLLCDDSFLGVLQASDPGQWEPANLPSVELPPPDNGGEPSTSTIDQSKRFSAVESGNQGAVSFNRRLRQIANGNPILQQNWMKELDEIIAMDYDVASPGVSQRRRSMEARYCTFVSWRRPDLEYPEGYWLEETVMVMWEPFVVALITTSRGYSGEDGQTLRSTTVELFAVTLVWLIAKKTVNKAGERVGPALLHQGKVFIKLRERCTWLSHQAKLERHPKQQVFIGRCELQLMYRQAFNTTREANPIGFQQSHVLMNLGLHLGLRAGSIGWSFPKYRDWGFFMKLRDICVDNEGDCRWPVTVTVRNFKGSNSTTSGRLSKFRLDPAEKIQNLLWDTGTHMLTYLFMRGALEGIESVEDIINYNRKTFKIKESMLDEPLMLEYTAGGHGLGKRPASASSLSDALATLGNAVGIPGVTMHAIRRGTGSMMSLVQGTAAAQTLLGHAEARNIANNHYSLNTLGLKVVQVSLGSLDSTASKANQITLKKRNQSELALKALIYQQHQNTSEAQEDSTVVLEKVKSKLTAEELAEVEKDPKVIEAREAFERLWDKFHELIPPRKKRVTTVASINSVFKGLKSNDMYKKNKNRLADIQDKLRVAGEDLTGARRAAKKNPQKLSRKRIVAEMTNINPTLEEQDKAQKALAEIISSDKSIPRSNDLLTSLLSVDLKKPGFGDGLLSSACKQLLAQPNLVELVKSEQRANEPETSTTDDSADTEDLSFSPMDDPIPVENFGEESDPPVSAGLNDKDEMEVFEGNRPEVIVAMMEELIRPVIQNELDKRIVKEHGDKWVCMPCKRLPEKERPGRGFLFQSKGHLVRHQTAHGPWFMMTQFMFTDDESVYKCPIQDCTFRADEIALVRDHCLDECKEKDLFNHLFEQGSSARTKSAAEVDAKYYEKLRVAEMEEGVPIKSSDLDRLGHWATFDSPKARALEEEFELEPEALRSFEADIAELASDAQSMVSAKGILKDPRAGKSFQAIVDEVLTPERRQMVEQAVEKANAGENE